MDKFKRMIQTAKAGRISAMQGEEHLDPALDLFMKACDQNEIFVFEEPKKNSSDLEEIPWGDEPIDAPFKVFSIEFEENFNICRSPGNENPHVTECIMVEELNTDKAYRFYVLVYNVIDEYYFVTVTENKDYYSPLVKNNLDMLNKSHCGEETMREMVSVRKGKKKHLIKKDRQFIVCGSKGSRVTYEKSGREVDWNHTTSVRGHWRRQFCVECKGSGCVACDDLGLRKGFLGKDRSGERVVAGKTWIAHYGDNVVKKIRKVKS